MYTDVKFKLVLELNMVQIFTLALILKNQLGLQI